MRRSLPLVSRLRLAGACLCAFNQIYGAAFAQDSVPFVIMKTEGEAPKIDAISVDRVGASVLYQILGEDFVVVTEPLPIAPQNSPMPIILPPGTIPPHIPICQCPEDYRAALEQRFLTIDIGKILQTQPRLAIDEQNGTPAFQQNEFLVPQIVPGLIENLGSANE